MTESITKRIPIPALAIIIDLACSVLLEIGTVMGYQSPHMSGLSHLMPKRLLVLFVLLLLPSFLAARRLHESGKGNSEQLRSKAGALWDAVRKCAPYLIAAIVAGLLLGLGAAHMTGNGGDIRLPIAFCAVCTAITLLVVNREHLVRAPEYGFAVLALAFGFTFCALMPTAAEISWDGHIHFDQANALSYLFDAEYTGADQIMCSGGVDGALLRLDDLAGTEEFDVELESRNVAFPHASLKKSNIDHANDMLAAAETSDEPVVVRGTQVLSGGTYLVAGSVGRIPQAVGLWFGRLLHLGPVARYTLARLCSVMAYVVVFFLAVRALKNGKLIMAAIGLCPTSLLMAANYAYDPWHICFIALAFAELIGALQRKRPLDWTDSARMLVPFALGTVVKAVLFPLAICFVLIPRDAFASTQERRKHLLLTGGTVLLLLSSFALPFLVSLFAGASTADVRGGSQVSTVGQVAYVLSHPVQSLMMGLRFGARMLNPARLGFAVTPADENLLYYSPYLIPASAPLNEFLSGCEFLLLAALGILDGDENDETFSNARFKIGSLVACGLSFTLIAGSMYVGFTAVGRDTISGVQYRYLLPLLAPFLLLVPNTGLRRRGLTKKATPAFYAVETALLILVLWNSFLWQM